MVLLHAQNVHVVMKKTITQMDAPLANPASLLLRMVHARNALLIVIQVQMVHVRAKCAMQVLKSMVTKLDANFVTKENIHLELVRVKTVLLVNTAM